MYNFDLRTLDSAYDFLLAFSGIYDFSWQDLSKSRKYYIIEILLKGDGMQNEG